MLELINYLAIFFDFRGGYFYKNIVKNMLSADINLNTNLILEDIKNKKNRI